MNASKKLLCFLFLTLFIVIAQAQGVLKNQQKIALNSPGKPYSLELNLHSASVIMSTYNGREIIVEVRDQSRAAAIDTAKQIFASSYKIESSQRNNAVVITNTNSATKIMLAVKVPANLAATLKVNVKKIGDVTLENIRGNIEVNANTGSVRLLNVAGSAVLSTVTGSVFCSFASMESSTPMAFSTLNGEIRLQLPVATKANFRMRSEKAVLLTDFDMDFGTEKSRVIQQGNKKRIAVNGSVNGSINGGGPGILVSNSTGNLSIEKK
ncbi:hypothetical protein JMG10_06915 [Nostoc ellipsosporum NOK]|nr:hypothetical protein [Nostoc ellipsosporum NOK]